MPTPFFTDTYPQGGGKSLPPTESHISERIRASPFKQNIEYISDQSRISYVVVFRFLGFSILSQKEKNETCRD